MISKYISWPIFLVSFVVGLICVYYLGPDSKNIYIYPTPQTYMNYQYKDKANQCFQFKPIQAKCPLNPLSVKTIPVQ